MALVGGDQGYVTRCLAGPVHGFMWFAADSCLPASSSALEARWSSGSLGPHHD